MKMTEPFTPIQHIIGTTQFCGLDFTVDEHCLIPRPETEILVEESMKFILRAAGSVQHMWVLDLCTGSGCIAISLFVKLTLSANSCKIIASDISAAALERAQRNVARHHAGKGVSFVQCDLFDGIIGRFDCIISNPPYIARHEFASLQKEVLREPRIALDGGEDGLDLYRRIAADAPAHLTCGGRLFLEIGWGQADAVRDILETSGLGVRAVHKDDAGIDRIVVAQLL